MKLNDVVVRTLPPPAKGQKTYYDDVLPNFGLRVSQGGTRTPARPAVKIFLSWCVKPPRRYIAISPCTGLSPHKRPSRTRVLSDTELQLIWRACEQTGCNNIPFGAVVLSAQSTDTSDGET